MHVNGFRVFLFERFVCKTNGSRVVNLGRRCGLWVPHFDEGGLKWDGYLAVEKGGHNFGFGG